MPNLLVTIRPPDSTGVIQKQNGEQEYEILEVLYSLTNFFARWQPWPFTDAAFPDKNAAESIFLGRAFAPRRMKDLNPTWLALPYTVSKGKAR